MIRRIGQTTFILSGMPMPPQSNNMYVSGQNWKTGKSGRFKSIEYQEYRKAMDLWAMAYGRDLKTCRSALLDAMGDQTTMIRLDRWFMFRRSRLATKYNIPKPMDASNRIKAFDDALKDALLIDDKFFWRGSEEKVEIEETQAEQVLALLTLTKRRHGADLLASLSSENPLPLLLGS